MDSDLRYAIKILKKYHQEHLLNFFDDLNDKEKKELISQINSTDFEKINKLYENSKLDDSIDYKRITPIKTWSKANLESSYINSAIEEGKKIISNNKLAIITLAGGQGTRLGYKGPKGSYEIDVPPKKSLFEFVCDNLKYNFFTSSIVPLCSIIMNTQKTKNKIIFNDVSKLYSQYNTFWIPISYTFI